MSKDIPKDMEFSSPEEFAELVAVILELVAVILRDGLPGGLYIETGDDLREVFVISRGERSAGSE